MKYIIANPLNFGSPSNSRSSIGHSFYNWLSALLIAKECGATFLHHPFLGDTTRYNSFLNLGDGFDEPTNEQKSKGMITHHTLHLHSNNVQTDINTLSDFKKFLNSVQDDTIIQFNQGAQFPGKYLIEKSEFVCDLVSPLYWKDKIPNRDESKINIGVHIRRGDISETRNNDRWKDLGHYRKIINDLQLQFPLSVVNIVSEGAASDFDIFSDCKLILNGSDLDAFHTLVSADILVTGQSTFSTLMAYITKGVVIYTPCVFYSEFDKFSSRFIRYDKINDTIKNEVRTI